MNLTPTPAPTSTPGPNPEPNPVNGKVYDDFETFFEKENVGITKHLIEDRYLNNNPFIGGEKIYFAKTIDMMIRFHTTKRVHLYNWFADIFDANKNIVPISLVSHKMCNINSIPGRSVSSSTLNKINTFVNKYNGYYENGEEKELLKMWAKFFYCLAKAESLGNPDSDRAKSAAKVYAKLDPKPAGVDFYYDKWQDNPKSRLNIGLFQFSPDYGGNINPCITNWNNLFKDYKIEKNKNMVNLLASTDQIFNAYCGVNKIAQTFFIQVNTTNSRYAYDSNSDKSKRCVSLHQPKSYVHFGPLINTTGSNLDKVYSCIQ
jgi:hypothetical protein